MSKGGKKKMQQLQKTAGPRTVPPPDGASDVLREAIAGNPERILTRMKRLRKVPESEAGWLALIAASDQAMVREVRASIDRPRPRSSATRSQGSRSIT